MVLLTETGYLKRMQVSEFEIAAAPQQTGTRSQGEDAVKLFIGFNDHDTLVLFNDNGVSYACPPTACPRTAVRPRERRWCNCCRSPRKKQSPR